MKEYLYKKLENCVENELFVVETTDGSEVYFYSGSLSGAKDYISNKFRVKKDGAFKVKSKTDRTRFYQTIQGDEAHFLVDLNGEDVSNVKWKITRFSPLVEYDETSNLQPHAGSVFVQHAPHSKPHDDVSQTMISYWEENVGKDKIVDLDNFTCPCCGKKTKREDIDGAHVKIVGKTGQYITPTCKECNEYNVVTERYFKVKEVDVVKAP